MSCLFRCYKSKLNL